MGDPVDSHFKAHRRLRVASTIVFAAGPAILVVMFVALFLGVSMPTTLFALILIPFGALGAILWRKSSMELALHELDASGQQGSE